MIPTIEDIIEELMAGDITKQKAINWLHLHAEGAANDLRDHFAAMAIAGFKRNTGMTIEQIAEHSYQLADAMMETRGKP